MTQHANTKLRSEPTARPGINTGRRDPFTHLLKDLAVLVPLMLLLAGLLTALLAPGYLFNLRYSLAIGVSILVISHLLMAWRKAVKLDWMTSGSAITMGTGVGILIGSLANGTDPLLLIRSHPNLLVTILLISLVFGPAISYYFYSRGIIAETTAALRQEELERISSEQRLTEANLRMLQAQIEPHFLFNTLSTILSLIRSRPDKAEQMLGNFTDYLRASLQQTRVSRIGLKEELAIIQSYLDIMAVRMEKRLQYRIEVPPELDHVMLPPLLIQPLVENAVVHGLEPKAEGGSIIVRTELAGDRLVVEVSDSGDGISPSSSMGVGMSNIRERLQLLYRGEASLQLLAGVPNGTIVRLTIPMDNGDAHE
jgi:signal transduction histidine kinase